MIRKDNILLRDALKAERPSILWMLLIALIMIIVGTVK